MHTVREFTHECDGERLSCRLAEPPAPATAPEHVVIMHGAGTGTKERTLPLAGDFADHGFRATVFDFSGHGESSGRLCELSLRRRYEQALGVIDAVAPDGTPLVLVGFSMSGQTVADLVAGLGDRVRAVCLCAPGVYSSRAWDVPFDARFTALIREPGSWRDSDAFRTYAGYRGGAVLVVPERDEVIPPGVTSGLETAFRGNTAFTRLTLDGADHRLGLWLTAHPAHRPRIVRAVVTALATTTAGTDANSGPE